MGFCIGGTVIVIFYFIVAVRHIERDKRELGFDHRRLVAFDSMALVNLITVPQVIYVFSSPHYFFDVMTVGDFGSGFLRLGAFYFFYNVIVFWLIGMVRSCVCSLTKSSFTELEIKAAKKFSMVFIALMFSFFSCLLTTWLSSDVRYEAKVPLLTYGDSSEGSVAAIDKHCPNGVVVEKLNTGVSKTRDVLLSGDRIHIRIDLICRGAENNVFKYGGLNLVFEDEPLVADEERITVKLGYVDIEQEYTVISPKAKNAEGLDRNMSVITLVFNAENSPKKELSKVIEGWGYLIPMIGVVIDEHVGRENRVNDNHDAWSNLEK